MKFLNKLAILLIKLYQYTFSSHTWIFKDFLYSKPVCTHNPHCSEYWKQCFEKYDFLTALKFTMERIINCKPSNTIKYDPSSYKVIFFSSAPIWVPFLKKLVEDKRFEVVWVVTMPDAPAWRGQKLKENIIAEEAKKLWITNIYKPEKIKNNENLVKQLKSLNPDFFVVISYWKILPKEILQIPKFWPINIHWSILPKYRWASPIQSVFLNWEKESWITIMYMDEWMDTGDIIKILKIPLDKKDNAKTLIDKFIKFWPDFLVDVLWDFWKWKLKRTPQNDSEATYCRKFTKEDGKIDFKNETAEEIYRKFQAFYLWPGIYDIWNWKLVKFTDIEIDPGVDTPKELIWKRIVDKSTPGSKKIKVYTKDWAVIINKLKLEWKKEMTAEEFINWYKDFLD